MLSGIILKSLYFFLPAYCANMAPVLFRWLPGGVPVSKRWFGSNKTWRGIAVAILAGGLVFWVQRAFYEAGFQEIALIAYSDFSIALGFLLGAGAILGDLVKSYLKRGYNLPPGARWLPWDQLDFVFGGIIFSWFVYVPPAEVVLVLLAISPLLHIAINHIAYWLSIRKEKW